MENLNKKLSKTICFLLLLVFFGNTASRLAFAQPFSGTEDVSISARVGEEVVVTPGGGSSGFVFPKTAVRFSGEAYPGATVFTLKEGVPITFVLADSLGYFSATLPEDYDSTIVYTLYATDLSGEKSLLINYPIVIRTGYLTHLSGIRFAPTIVTDKAEVRFGDHFTVTGYSLPSANLEVLVEGQGTQEKKNFSLTSNADGTYKIILPMQGLSTGDYVVSIKYQGDTRISKLVKFIIGELNVPNTDIVENIPGDCNYDSIINLVDFSVLAFWYGKENPPKCVDTNRDNKIDLTDFSILAFWWTG